MQTLLLLQSLLESQEPLPPLQTPVTSPVQVRLPPPQSVSLPQVTDEQEPATTPWQLYWVPSALQSLVAQQVLVGPVHVPALEPLHVRVPPQEALVVQLLAGQLPSVMPAQVAPVP
jgi:hypothetical protein